MSESKAATRPVSETASCPMEMTPENILHLEAKVISAALDQARLLQTYWLGLSRYALDFMAPAFSALESFVSVENDKIKQYSHSENICDYASLLEFNLRLAEKGLTHGLKALADFQAHQLEQLHKAWHNTLYHQKGEDIAAFMAKQARLLELVVHEYPQAIKAIEPEYGFHFEDGNYIQVAETQRFVLYQVLPWDKSVQVREKGKPILIIPPFVLGANILAFLPGEGKSFVHCFANQGIPTYIRIVKDIYAHPAVQTMTGEEDCLDTKLFLQKIKAAHGRPATLCGYCQGGFTAIINYLSGELDGLVDALISSVAPMDGTKSKGLVDFLAQIPKRFDDINFAIKTLPNGNRVVNGKLMSWVYKLKSMEKDNPLVAFVRDLKLFERNLKINKTAAAINYWLLYDQTDLPLEIIRLSFDSYTIPVAPDGTLPVRLFDRPLNFTRVKEKGLKWLICIAEKDDLVEAESALAPSDWVDAEVAVFPKGHVAIATSWSLPDTECSLDRCFLHYRGPVRFHLDVEAEAEKTPAPPRKRTRAAAPAKAMESKAEPQSAPAEEEQQPETAEAAPVDQAEARETASLEESQTVPDEPQTLPGEPNHTAPVVEPSQPAPVAVIPPAPTPETAPDEALSPPPPKEEI
ncbi:MAG: metal transporter [Deltaproteobacteria bacterium]|nr:metal transporter [Deltaproteobacteria bacterium]